MISRAFKLRFRRRLRMRKLQVEELGQQAEQQLERNFFRRLERLADVRRFVLTWIVLLVLIGGCVAAQITSLRGYYQVPEPVPGGTYSEGVLGAYTNANPVYATSPADLAVSRLLFAGLMTYDENNNLIGDLAEGWTVDEQGTTYTVRLKPGLKWHDGKSLTAADVAFTYQIIQNPDAQSPLNPSWRGITVKEVDARTVTFTLPNQLISFPYSLTNGIIPKHVLGKEPVASLRTLRFNTTQPVGSGPFMFSALEVSGGAADTRQERIGFDPFEQYHAGKPKLSRFVVYIFRNEQMLVRAFKAKDIDAIAGLTKVPKELEEGTAYREYSLPLTAAVMTFFKTSEGTLADVKIRQALVHATDRKAVMDKLSYPTHPVRSPLLHNQIGYNATYNQASLDVATANKLLDEAGWRMNDSQVRRKDGQPLAISLTVQENSEYEDVARMLQRQWRLAGVDVEVVPLNTLDFQTALAEHNYEALLYGISIGKDPDVFVYWDSKQAISIDNRLNFSEYKSSVADAALQAGRTRSDAALRAVKYQPFLQAWRDDAPAVGLYEPRFLYITHTTVHGLAEKEINAPIERFKNVHNWMIREKGVSQTKR